MVTGSLRTDGMPHVSFRPYPIVPDAQVNGPQFHKAVTSRRTKASSPCGFYRKGPTVDGLLTAAYDFIAA